MGREMKDSGIEWIGKIPSTWIVKKSKTLFCQRNTRGNKEEVLLSPTQKFGVIPQSQLDGVVKVKEETDLQTFKTIHKGDFVISLRSFQGGFEYSRFEGVCSPAYQVFYPIDTINDMFFKYLFKSENFISKMNNLTVGIRDGKNIQYKDFANSLIAVPPLEEQHRIASYLDTQCLEIDNTLEKTRASVEEYKKLKQAVIIQAVTKGVRGERPMKDSGIEWIGEIPEEWNVRKLGGLASDEKYSIVDGPFGSDMKNEEYVDEGIPIVQLTNIKQLAHYTDSLKYISEEKYQQLIRHTAYAGDIVIAKMMPAGRACILSDKYPIYVVAADAIRFKANDPTCVRYILYCLNSYCMDECNILSKGTTRVRISLEIARKLKIALPNMKEQIEIVEYLDNKCSEIDSLISKKEQFLIELERYKKSLIYECVTGKREV